MLIESLGYLRSSDDLLFTVLVGGMLTFFSWLFVPWFIILGFIIRVLDRTSNGNDNPPIFENWTELLISGFKAFVIILIYGLVPLFFGGLVLAIGTLGTALGEQPRFIGIIGLAFAGILTLIATIIIGYIVPAALANFVDRSSVLAAFSIRTIGPVLLSNTYAKGWLTAAVIVVGATLSSLALGVIPYVGWFIGAMVFFYAYVSAFYIFGHVWAETRAVSVTPG